MLTHAQEEFLAAFADKEIEKITLEAERVEKAEAERIKSEAREAQIAAIKAQKEQELKDALAALEQYGNYLLTKTRR